MGWRIGRSGASTHGLAAAMVYGLAVSCAALTGAEDESSTCESNEDCRCGEYCATGPDDSRTCQLGCETDADCPGGGLDGDERCEAYVTLEKECVDGQCLSVCTENRCGDMCCTYGEVCCGGTCCGYPNMCCGDTCCTSTDSCCGDQCCDGSSPAEDCAEPYYACDSTTDCCNWSQGEALCVTGMCLSVCNQHSDCTSGCCGALQETVIGACLFQEICANPSCQSSQDCATACCIVLIDGAGRCASSSHCGSDE